MRIYNFRSRSFLKGAWMLMFAWMVVLSACTFDTSDNGDLDGYWHLERADTLATGGTANLEERRIFWGVQFKLIACTDIDREGQYGYYFRFRQTGDSLIVHTPYKNSWHQEGGVGGDIPVNAINDSIRTYGINQLEEPFLKEKLKGDKMILRSKTLRLYFTKF